MEDKQIKHIMLLTGTMGSGGIERESANIANYYASRGHKVTVAPLLYDNLFYELHPNVRYVSFVQNGGLRSFKLRRWKKALRNYVIQNKVDVMICMDVRVAFVGIHSCHKIPGLKIITRESNTNSGLTLFLNKFIYSKYYKHADIVTLQNEEQREIFKSKWAKHIEVIPNAFNPSVEPNKDSSINLSSHDICLVARLELQQKAQDVAIKAFRLFLNDNPGYKLHLFGNIKIYPENLKLIQDLIRENNLQDNVIIEGEVKNILETTKNYRCFLMSSRWEGLPNSLVEAQLIGLPVVSTAWNGVESVITNNETGLIAKVDDPTDIASKLSKLVHDDWLYLKLRENGIALKNKYSMDAVMTRWEPLVFSK